MSFWTEQLLPWNVYISKTFILLSFEIVLCVKMCENLFNSNDKIIISVVLILSLSIITIALVFDSVSFQQLQTHWVSVNQQAWKSDLIQKFII